MRLVEDERQFDHLMYFLTDVIVRTVKKDTEGLGLETEDAKNLVASVAFAVCAIVDGSRVMELDGKSVLPVLTFQIAEEELPALWGRILDARIRSWLGQRGI